MRNYKRIFDAFMAGNIKRPNFLIQSILLQTYLNTSVANGLEYEV